MLDLWFNVICHQSSANVFFLPIYLSNKVKNNIYLIFSHLWISVSNRGQAVKFVRLQNYLWVKNTKEKRRKSFFIWFWLCSLSPHYSFCWIISPPEENLMHLKEPYNLTPEQNPILNHNKGLWLSSCWSGTLETEDWGLMRQNQQTWERNKQTQVRHHLSPQYIVIQHQANLQLVLSVGTVAPSIGTGLW